PASHHAPARGSEGGEVSGHRHADLADRGVSRARRISNRRRKIMAESFMRIFAVLCLAISLVHAEPSKFRTDADGPVKADEKKKNPKDKNAGDRPDWFQLVEGQFPPAGSTPAISG